MKKIFYTLGVYTFCVMLHEFFNTPISEIKHHIKGYAKAFNIKGFEDSSESKEASCKLKRIGF